MSSAEKSEGGIKTISRNRKALHDYFVVEKFEAGMILVGSEVKSLRAGRINLTDAYARFEQNELWLVKAHISPYEQANRQNHDPERPRKLLMHRRELRRLQGKVQTAGLTLIPLSLYFKDSRVKVEIGLCRGKKHYDKREDMRRKDHARDIERARREHAR
jgi:SsrA-binding protein